MTKNILALLLLCAAPALPARAGDMAQANALLLVPSERTAFDPKFQDFLEKGGVRLTESYPPSVFVGYVPEAMDKPLASRYGATVYRERVDDWASFAQYGEKAVYAVNAWNKRFLEDPPAAPLVVSSKVAIARGRGVLLKWNEVMKAVYYRLQISADKDFSAPLADTLVAGNEYLVAPGFRKDGVYYWRVSGIMTLNNGERRDGAFSAAYTFALPAVRPSGRKLPAPPPPVAGPKGLSWGRTPGLRYYRLQISADAGFAAPLLDVYTDTCAYGMSGLPVKAPYYSRIMGSDGSDTGGWSQVSKIEADDK